MPAELTTLLLDNLPMIVLGVLGTWVILALWPDDADETRAEPDSDGPIALGVAAAAATAGAAVALLDEPEPASDLPDDDGYDPEVYDPEQAEPPYDDEAGYADEGYADAPADWQDDAVIPQAPPA